VDCLQGKLDRFGGIDVEPEGFRESIAEFGQLLARSLQEWRRQGLKVVWLKIARDDSCLIPAALDAGFDLHHCRPAYVMLTCRLISAADFPGYATHFIGAGGVVLSDRNELLVVLEEYDALERPNAYKLPGGLVEADERIEDAIAREVLEETGVRTRFEGIIGFAQIDSWFLQRPSLYFVCRLTPFSRSIELPEAEIAEARWMPVEDYLADNQVLDFNKRVVLQALSSEEQMLVRSTVAGRAATMWSYSCPGRRPRLNGNLLTVQTPKATSA
jgi:8-oxo-dGTP pyrophosphatase MutT (NUDIX family)